MVWKGEYRVLSRRQKRNGSSAEQMTSMLRWIKRTSKKELYREGDKKTLQVKGRTCMKTQNFFFTSKRA